MLFLFSALLFCPSMLFGQEVGTRRYNLVSLGADTVRLVPMADEEVLEGRMMLRVDLNADGKEDILVNLGACGNWGHCIMGVFVQEEQGIYRSVWSEYVYDYNVLEEESTWVDGQPWKKILLIDRGDYGGGDPADVPLEILEYNKERYVSVPAGIGRYENGVLQRPDVFRVYATADGAGDQQGVRYELGRSEPANYTIHCAGDTCYYLRRDMAENGWQGEGQFLPHAPIVLRMRKDSVIQDIRLPYFQDIDMVKLYNKLPSPYLVIVQRYAFSLFDVKDRVLSPTMVPGRKIDYREDAISGIMDGFLCFDDGRYLLGNAQGYGLFCFDVSEMQRPIELRRYSSQAENNGQPYFFLGRRKNGRWDGLLARSDMDSEIKGINNLYKKTENVRYSFSEENLREEPKPSDPLQQPLNHLLLHREDGVSLLMDLATGWLDEGI